MTPPILYKNCLIRGESFQLAQNGGWIPRYTLTQPDSGNCTPSRHDRLDQVFWTAGEADQGAILDAIQWIDENVPPQSSTDRQ